MTFQRLGLVITDEQHRFGVEQRSALAAKANPAGAARPHCAGHVRHPHPPDAGPHHLRRPGRLGDRRAAPGRIPVRTLLVGESKRRRMYGFVREQVRAGRQVYIVCPAVEENPESEWDLKAVNEYARVPPGGGLPGVPGGAGPRQAEGQGEGGGHGRLYCRRDGYPGVHHRH
ncbi:MAG: hypothetical protein ACLSAF_21455 [Intestinimonas sp.]